MTKIILGLLTALVLVGSFFMAPRAGKSAAASGQTTLRLDSPASVVLGEHGQVTGRLDLQGRALAEEVIEYSIDGIYIRKVRTDADGLARFVFPNNISAGRHTILARFKGVASKQLLPSSSSGAIQVLPARLSVEIEPPTAGLRFALAGVDASSNRNISASLTSDANGLASLAIYHPGKYRLDFLDVEKLEGDQRIQFAKWSDGRIEPSRFLEVPGRIKFEIRVSKTVPTAIDMILPAIRVAEKGSLAAKVRTTTGQPINDGGIEFWVDGALEGRSRTDDSGTALLVIRSALVAGPHSVKAVFTGVPSKRLERSESSARLDVAPARVLIKTVPPLEGVDFTLKSAEAGSSLPELRARSNAAGNASFLITTRGRYEITVGDFKPDSETRVEFQRWQDEGFTPSKIFQATPEVNLEAGFEISYLVSHHYVDLAGKPVAPERVQSVRIASSHGEKYTLSHEPIWLAGWRVVRGKQGLEAAEIEYSIEKINIDGSSVVNRGQQRLTPSRSTVWQMEVKLYSLKLTARDALFRTRTGAGFTLIYPDGRSEYFAFNRGSKIKIDGLARGEYRVQVDKAVAAKTIPISMTQDQAAEIKIITTLDIIFVISSGVVVAVGLLLIGRFHAVSFLRLKLAARGIKPSPAPQELVGEQSP